VTLGADDVAEINHLYAAYNHAVDAGDGVAFASCFTADGSLDYGSGQPASGADALAAFARGVPSTMPGIRHLAANILLDGSGDRATGAAYFVALISGAQPQILMTGRYRDTLRRDDGAWRFVERTFEADS
jgi:uncharacterized protein (TIGR02246 family)